MHPRDLPTAIVEHRRLVIVAFLVATAGMVAGAVQVEQDSSLDGFQTDSEAAQALDRIQQRYDATGENVTSAQVVVEREDALSREGLIETLRYQQAIQTDERVAPTLTEARPTHSVASVVATAAVRRERGGGGGDGDSAGGAGSAGASDRPMTLTIDAQIAQLESMDAAEIERTIRSVLTADRSELLMLLPADYEVGETSADATMVLVRQDTRGEFVSIDTAPDHLIESQQAMADLGDSRNAAEYRVFGVGITAAVLTHRSRDRLKPDGEA